MAPVTSVTLLGIQSAAIVGWLSSLGELGFHIGHHYHRWPW
jgi:hypothetical protein